MKQNDMLVENVPNIVAACCVPHNICEIHGDMFSNEWMQAVNGDSVLSDQELNNTKDGHNVIDALITVFL